MKNSSCLDLLTYEFHVAKHLREKYELDELFFSITGNVIFANFYQVRVFTQKINSKRNIYEHLSPGEVNAAGLLDEIFHFAIKKYFKENFPNAFSDAIKSVKDNLGDKNFDKLLLNFINIFPPQKVFKNEVSPKEYLNQFTENIQNREILTEELILLHIANLNPAFNKLKELFSEEYISEKVNYKSTIFRLENFFKKEELKIGVKNIDLFTFLKMPFQKHSDSIWDQLEFIKNEWGISIDVELMRKIESGKDLYIESIKFNQHFDGGFVGGGGAPTIVPQYKGKSISAESFVLGKSKFKYAEDASKDYEEFEQFTPDTNWMPKLVLIAKNIYVWLDQLSKKYQREIRTLDKIPIEELALLKKWNINSLWLIGVWERSHASKRIKHLMGNLDAVASAYSLYDYEIAHNLGGEEAYRVFNNNAKSVGIRLASDMVPNHTGIFSKWIIEHPEYFVQLDYPPFPNYSFTGTNLSENSEIELRLEDQYWQMKDAAVVFQRKDLRNGDVKYIYHGNDGTNMPWNDTAQLNMLKAEVREAVIQKIFDVARKFSVIRFDAAMTLAKKHFSRLWYPEPGKGGDIPSRADFALTREEFDEFFPKEFWREVVDRINDEMPETLLLAEAFWLMEGYFVRTLGMHRVYNSAFMHMMMKEENSKYRELITNTLEFEPEILKRYVNFMSNPDEETAINQFGTDDKYFGVLIMMCTLPGLPMLAHGQIEGYTEKYGMEYQRAYYNETPQHWLVERHEREVFPILGKRYLFAEVDNFWFFDFIDNNNNLNENVFAYSNSHNNEKALVIYNNKFHPTSGYINFSRQKLKNNSANKYLTNIKISDQFKIQNSQFHFYIFKDNTHQTEYLFNGKDICDNGLFLNLKGFEYRVFLNIEEIYDQSEFVYNFYKENFGKEISNVKEQLEEHKLIPIQNSFKQIFNEENINKFCELAFTQFVEKEEINGVVKKIEEDYSNFVIQFKNHFNVDINYDLMKTNFHHSLRNFIELTEITKIKKVKKTKSDLRINEIFSDKKKINFVILIINEVINCTKEIIYNENIAKSFPKNLRVTKTVQNVFEQFSNNEFEATRNVILLNLLINQKEKIDSFQINFEQFMKLRSKIKLFDLIKNSEVKFIEEFFENEFTQSYIDVNEYEKVKYFSKERFESLINLFQLFAAYKIYSNNITLQISSSKSKVLSIIRKLINIENHLNNLAIESKFVFTDLLKNFDNKNKLSS
ncbi:MAG: alpha-amylase [Ignavibacteriae bacterium]|nr:alpha-amylase [Ignavibacteriota bacterium]